MSSQLDPARLLREARSGAGLTQRELARRAGTAQSVIARIETGQSSPTVETLLRLLEAAGFEPRTQLAVVPVLDSHMLDDVGRILSLTPEERLVEIRNLSRFTAAARHV